MFKPLLLSVSILATLTSSSAFAFGFASIAYNPATHKFGESHGVGNLILAENEAVSYCAEFGCRTVGWAQNGYVALAEGAAGWGSASSNFSLADAENRALSNCSLRTGGCHILVWASAF